MVALMLVTGKLAALRRDDFRRRIRSHEVVEKRLAGADGRPAARVGHAAVEPDSPVGAWSTAPRGKRYGFSLQFAPSRIIHHIKNSKMCRFFLRVAVGLAFVFSAHAQPKPPPEKTPAVQEKKPATAAKTGQGMENAHAMCIGCHGIPGYKTAFPDVYHVPKIAGQQPGYIVNALKAYKSGERSHPSMRGIAASLSEEDMKQLADYYGGAK
jgi:cytochrome c553